MVTQAVNSSRSTGAAGNQMKNKNFEVKPEQFIQMMITQLQNQDPMEPTKNSELLAQMSQIGQLQSATMLQDSIKSLMLQGQIGSAGNLIGKMVQGLDDENEAIKGIVTSVRVEGDKVALELDSGKTLQMSRVTGIAPAAAATATIQSSVQGPNLS